MVRQRKLFNLFYFHILTCTYFTHFFFIFCLFDFVNFSFVRMKKLDFYLLVFSSFSSVTVNVYYRGERSGRFTLQLIYLLVCFLVSCRRIFYVILFIESMISSYFPLVSFMTLIVAIFNRGLRGLHPHSTV